MPRESFLGLVEGFLNQNNRLYPYVEEMAQKKTFSCKERGCGKPFDAWPPDDMHIIPNLEKKEGAIERSYQCPDKHINVIYWEKSAGHIPIVRST